MREHLELVAKQTGKTPEDLELPEFPPVCFLVWSWFISLHKKRTSNGFGANPITYTEMQAFFNLSGEQPMQWELEAISKLDDLILDIQAQEAKKKQNKK